MLIMFRTVAEQGDANETLAKMSPTEIQEVLGYVTAGVESGSYDASEAPLGATFKSAQLSSKMTLANYLASRFRMDLTRREATTSTATVTSGCQHPSQRREYRIQVGSQAGQAVGVTTASSCPCVTRARLALTTLPDAGAGPQLQWRENQLGMNAVNALAQQAFVGVPPAVITSAVTAFAVAMGANVQGWAELSLALKPGPDAPQ